MRVTKDMFLMEVKDISNLMGEQLYLIPCGYRMYVSPVNNGIECQYNYYLSMDNSFSNANYDKLIAFEKGIRAAIKRMQNR